MVKTSSHTDVTEFDTSIGRPVTADLLLDVSKLVNFASSPGEQHLSLSTGNDDWSFGADSTSDADTASSSYGVGPLKHGVGATETTIIDTDVYRSHAGSITGEVYVHGSSSGTCTVKLMAGTTTSVTGSYPGRLTFSTATASTGWTRLRVTLQRLTGTATLELRSVNVWDYPTSPGVPGND